MAFRYCGLIISEYFLAFLVLSISLYFFPANTQSLPTPVKQQQFSTFQVPQQSLNIALATSPSSAVSSEAATLPVPGSGTEIRINNGSIQALKSSSSAIVPASDGNNNYAAKSKPLPPESPASVTASAQLSQASHVPARFGIDGQSQPTTRAAPMAGYLAANGNSIDVSNSNSNSYNNNNNNNNNENSIEHLDYSSLSDEILHRPTVNLVYFNANFNQCRHCSKFLAIWRELANDIKWWRQMIRLFTINCSEDDNIEMCRKAGVSQFPQVKYYWVMSSSLEQDGQRLRILGKSVHAMRHMIVDRVMDSYSEHQRLVANRKGPASSLATRGDSPAAARGAPSLNPNPLMSFLSPMLSQFLADPSAALQLVAKTNPASGASAGGTSGGAPAKASGAVQPDMLGNLLEGFMGSGKFSGSGVPAASQLLSTALSLGGGPAARAARAALSVEPLPGNWAELEPMETADSVQLIGSLPLDAGKGIGALLIMETQEFLYTGLEVLLDLSPYSNQTYVARVRDERSELSRNLTKRDDIRAPTLIWVSGRKEPRLIMTAPKYSNDEDLRRAFVRAFERRHIKYPVRRLWSSAAAHGATSGGGGGGDRQAEAAAVKRSQEDEELLARVHRVYMQDLINAMRASLMEQVFRHPDLSDDQYNALVKYVYTLINYFPLATEEQLKFLRRLHTWLQNQVSPVDINEYKKQFHDVDEVFARREWLACKSLSDIKVIPSKWRKTGVSLFESPHQLGRMMSNITRLFRGQKEQSTKLKSLISTLAASIVPAAAATAPPPPPASTPRPEGAGTGAAGAAGASPAKRREPAAGAELEQDTPIERIIKSLTSGSLGSDSSILKLIASALGAGGSGGGGSGGGAGPGRSKFAREYPCGAWKLAHVLVASEYAKDSPRKDVRHIVLHSLYQYMLHFYACPTCGNRVSDVANEFRLNLEQNLKEQSDSVMLLWKVHNRVSKRLESEFRPGSPAKQQFPSVQLCPKCHSPAASGQSGQSGQQPNWQERQVLHFLVHHYRPLSIESGSNLSSAAAGQASSAGGPRYGARLVHRALGPLQAGLWLALGFLLARPWRGHRQ